MPFDFDALVAPFLMQPGLRRLAAGFVACEPSLLAHAMLATTDIAVTAGVVAAHTVTTGAAEQATRETVSRTPDHDPATGEIFDRDRHHHWDTV